MSNGKNGRGIEPEPGKKVDIRDYDAGDTPGMSKDEAIEEIARLRIRLNETEMAELLPDQFIKVNQRELQQYVRELG